MKILVLTFGFFICTAFNKPDNSIALDYRDAYTGIYFCNKWCSIGIGTETSLMSDTISISITKDATDSVLNFNVGNQDIKFKLQGKNLLAYPKSGHYGGELFASDSLTFFISTGHAHTCSYKGKKKS